MRTSRYLTIFSLILLGSVLPAAAQRTRPKPTPNKSTVNPIVSAAKQQVANQLYNVKIFVDKMGPIAVSIENLDRQASARRLKRTEIDANEANKRKLIAAIRGLRDGLVTLETDFRTKPQLTQYLSRIDGISSLCARSEDSAIAGRFVASKDPLRQVALKLNDTLAVLPGALSADNSSRGAQYQPVPASLNQSRPATTDVNQTGPITTNVKQTRPGGATPIRTTSAPPASSAKRDVYVGMTTYEAQQSSWGVPPNKRVSTTQNGTTEVWLYPGNRSLYFFNGKLTRIVQ